jgi:hypothetical protein
MKYTEQELDTHAINDLLRDAAYPIIAMVKTKGRKEK